MIGSQELILILAILLILIGPKKLPEMAKELGMAIQKFNKANATITDIATSALNDEENEQEAIVRIARNLEINVEGKSTKQLIGEIERKMVKNRENVDINENR